MYRINGCGTAVYGKRDVDAKTDTYVTTHVITLLFIPVFCLGAYRVRDGGSSGLLFWSRSQYYFLERVRLSTLARCWNYVSGAVIALLLVSALVGR